MSRSFEDRGGRSPLIIKDLDLYPQPPTNTRSPTPNSEEPHNLSACAQGEGRLCVEAGDCVRGISSDSVGDAQLKARQEMSLLVTAPGVCDLQLGTVSQSLAPQALRGHDALRGNDALGTQLVHDAVEGRAHRVADDQIRVRIG